ncbi:hypothetical protein Scep_025721 [Stephania cephalantha]|uniref:Uncharacterized protein n=1 Tax=Stephania cephalantha TaxID=152367 RepID=A0AAP0EM21_9MAGN
MRERTGRCGDTGLVEIACKDVGLERGEKRATWQPALERDVKVLARCDGRTPTWQVRTPRRRRGVDVASGRRWCQFRRPRSRQPAVVAAFACRVGNQGSFARLGPLPPMAGAAVPPPFAALRRSAVERSSIAVLPSSPFATGQACAAPLQPFATLTSRLLPVGVFAGLRQFFFAPPPPFKDIFQKILWIRR